jgi:hypothetical protein
MDKMPLQYILAHYSHEGEPSHTWTFVYFWLFLEVRGGSILLRGYHWILASNYLILGEGGGRRGVDFRFSLWEIESIPKIKAQK